VKQTFAFAALSFSFAAALSAAETAQQQERPNILFIAIDDLRPELSCYGVSDIRSPNIDRPAVSGVRFERAFC
jgi:iduronate 2-sulfatase